MPAVYAIQIDRMFYVVSVALMCSCQLQRFLKFLSDHHPYKSIEKALPVLARVTPCLARMIDYLWRRKLAEKQVKGINCGQ